MVASIRVHQPWLGITDTDVLCIKIAGLCHDLGHGPFSHVFDGIFIKTLKRHKLISDTFNWTHEQGSLDMLDHLLVSNHISIEEYGLSRQDLTFIKELIYGGPLPGSDGVLHGRPASNQRFLYDFVNNAQSGLDVDKLDYFMRDALHTGAKASCDVDLLIRNARVLVDRDDKHGKMAICFPEKLSGQVMQAFHTRFDLHQSVYQHKAIRAIEYMICDVFLAANDHIKIKDKKISDIVTSMSAYQHLDDRVLARIQESDNLELAEAKSILNRMFTKPYYECRSCT
uniref:HD domain-containing protein n=1 Tax=Globisporangium ultimum (strain ATCC 200006 / CBS 805.95 / DAOM BR144) TaxID=431595 RepID=K3X7T5_GLOUD